MTWQGGLAKVTIEWEGGAMLVANKVKVTPEDLRLEFDEQQPFIFEEPHRVPPPLTKGRMVLDADMLPDEEDCFYTFRVGT